ncbi:MAG: hypothetical protein ACE5F1_13055 [Planctomycetota bacterium]
MRPLSRAPLVAVWILSLASLGSAQRTWIVDAANGAGTDFKDIPPALAAASDGDRILVRKGTYTPGTTGKALRMAGLPGAVIHATPTNKNFVVTGLSRSKSFVMRGFKLTAVPAVFTSWGAPLQIRNCEGRVHLEAITSLIDSSAILYSVQVQQCRAVSLANCALVPGLSAYKARIVATGCLFFGHDGPPVSNRPGSFGVDVHTSVVDLVQVLARGGSGGGHGPPFQAVRANQTTLYVRGDSRSQYKGGLYGRVQTPALWGFSTSGLVLDPSVTLINGYQSFRKVTVRRLPSLTGSGAALGGQAKLGLYSEKGKTFALFLALSWDPLVIPGLGESWLDAATFQFVTSGVMDASERFGTSLLVPKDPAFLGQHIAFQAITSRATGFEMSNPVVIVLK